MKIRTDFVTNSSCACFVCYKNDSEELAKALKKFFFKTNKETYDDREDGNNFLSVDSGIYAQYEDIDASCAHLEGGCVMKYCPINFEANLSLKDILFDKKYIFDDDKQHNSREYVETTDGKLYDCKDITYLDLALSYHNDIFDNLAYYSREQFGENPEEGVERLKFNYPSLAKAMLLDIQEKNIAEWKEELADYGEFTATVEIYINDNEEFLGTFKIIIDEDWHEKYPKTYTLHLFGNGDIEISASLKLPNKSRSTVKDYGIIYAFDEIDVDCWYEESCHECEYAEGCGRKEGDWWSVMKEDDDCSYSFDKYSLEKVRLRDLFRDELQIYPTDVFAVLNDGSTIDENYILKNENNRYFILNSPDVKPIGHVEHEFENRFYILYDANNRILDLFSEEDFQKLIDGKNFTFENEDEDHWDKDYWEMVKIYEKDSNKLVYTAKYTNDDCDCEIIKIYEKDSNKLIYTAKHTSISELIEVTEGGYEDKSYRKCGYND